MATGSARAVGYALVMAGATSLVVGNALALGYTVTRWTAIIIETAIVLAMLYLQ